MIGFVSPIFHRLNIGENKFINLWSNNDSKDKNERKKLEKKLVFILEKNNLLIHFVYQINNHVKPLLLKNGL